MNCSSPGDILCMPTSQKEALHKSRKRIGYHVYLSAFFREFQALTYEQKSDKLVKVKVWDKNEMGDDESVDSVLTQQYRSIQCYDIVKVAAMKWREMDSDMKLAWGQRADKLNERPQNDGKFLKIPDDILKSSIQKNVLVALSMEWLNFVRTMKSCIWNGNNVVMRGDGKNEKKYKFGNEIVLLHSQYHRSFTLNHLLIVSIFGFPLFSNIKSNEIVYRSKK